MGTAPSSKEDIELCPACGGLFTVNEISPQTGWCYECTPLEQLPASARERWLASNADHIEHYIAGGISAASAIVLVRIELRTRCVVCGEHIYRARKTAVFCRRYAECRRQSRKYVYLYRERGFTKAAALAKVLTDLTGE